MALGPRCAGQWTRGMGALSTWAKDARASLHPCAVHEPAPGFAHAKNPEPTPVVVLYFEIIARGVMHRCTALAHGPPLRSDALGPDALDDLVFPCITAHMMHGSVRRERDDIRNCWTIKQHCWTIMRRAMGGGTRARINHDGARLARALRAVRFDEGQLAHAAVSKPIDHRVDELRTGPIMRSRIAPLLSIRPRLGLLMGQASPPAHDKLHGLDSETKMCPLEARTQERPQVLFIARRMTQHEWKVKRRQIASL